jgi:hypothetical protein
MTVLVVEAVVVVVTVVVTVVVVVFSVQLAVKVISEDIGALKLNGANSPVLYQPTNVYPLRVGVAGSLMELPDVMVCDVTVDPSL